MGDLPGILRRLDYLKELGVDVLWISPFYKSPGGDNGYDISDYQAIQPEFGTMEDFDRLLAGAHARGMRVGDRPGGQPHLQRASLVHREPLQPGTTPSGTTTSGGTAKTAAPPNNWGSQLFGQRLDPGTRPPASITCTPFGDFQPDLNWDNPAVRQEVFRMMRWWCDKGVDGFRMDVISMISKTPEMPDGERKTGAAATAALPPMWSTGPTSTLTCSR